MVLLAAWCAMRQGELFALTPPGIDLEAGAVHIRHGVVRVQGKATMDTTKTGKVRRVAIPDHIVPDLRRHLTEHTGPRQDDLLFPAKHGGYMAPATLYKVWYRARAAAGRDDLGSMTSGIPGPRSTPGPVPP